MMKGKLCEEVRLFSLCLRRVAMLAALTARTQQEPAVTLGPGRAGRDPTLLPVTRPPPTLL